MSKRHHLKKVHFFNVKTGLKPVEIRKAGGSFDQSVMKGDRLQFYATDNDKEDGKEIDSVLVDVVEIVREPADLEKMVRKYSYRLLMPHLSSDEETIGAYRELFKCESPVVAYHLSRVTVG